MPYNSPSDTDLPPHVRRLSPKKQRKWVAVFNSAYADSNGDDGAAMRAANGAVKERRGGWLLWRRKDLLTVPEDDNFWEEQREAFFQVVSPMLTEIFLAGAESAMFVKPVRAKMMGDKAEAAEQFLSVSIDDINTAAQRAVSQFSNVWWQQLETTTREGLRAAIQSNLLTGEGVEQTLKDIQPLFGPTRARAVAVTETTRLFGEGAQATYKLAGLEQWEWQTVSDSGVDAECAGRQGQKYDMDTAFQPAHVNCRCFPRPVVFGDEVPVREEILDFGEGAGAGEWLRKFGSSKAASELGPDGIRALRAYKGFYYKRINMALRSGKTEALVDGLDDAFRSAPALAQPLRVYRGVKNNVLPKNLSPGTVIKDEAFVSTTLSKTFAKDWASTVVEIVLPKGTRVLPPQFLTDALDYELELILRRGSSFRILEDTMIGRRRFVKVMLNDE